MSKINEIKTIYSAITSLEILAILVLSTLLVLPGKASAYYEDGRYFSGYPAPVYNPAPTIYSISPDNTNGGTAEKIVTLNGNNFMQGTTARINGVERKATYVSPNIIRVRLNSADLSKVGNHSITAANPSPGGGFSNDVIFRVNAVNSTVTSTTTVNTNTNNNSSNTSNTSTTSSTNNSNNSNNYSNTNSSSNFSGTDEGDTTGDRSDSARNLTSNAFFGSSSFFPTGIFQWILFVILILAIVFVWRKFFGNQARYHSSPLKHA